MKNILNIFFGIIRTSFDHKTVYGESTHSCGDLLTVYEYRQTDIWMTFLGIKISRLSHYKLIPVKYKRDYPLPATNTDGALRAFQNGIETNVIHYEFVNYGKN